MLPVAVVKHIHARTHARIAGGPLFPCDKMEYFFGQMVGWLARVSYAAVVKHRIEIAPSCHFQLASELVYALWLPK